MKELKREIKHREITKYEVSNLKNTLLCSLVMDAAKELKDRILEELPCSDLIDYNIRHVRPLNALIDLDDNIVLESIWVHISHPPKNKKFSLYMLKYDSPYCIERFVKEFCEHNKKYLDERIRIIEERQDLLDMTAPTTTAVKKVNKL